ncbi:MAG: DUF760 domain-containing protein [Hydrococcus sp. Prado102]|jgi:hypothetical protein|nr:DUF760 domain-containing protein [Hydrococcus sp. Prado102]
MPNLSDRIDRFVDNSESEKNGLLHYIQSLSPETIAQMSQPKPEVARIIERDLRQMLGILPAEHFDIDITTSREELAHILTEAMLRGYFLYNAQQRMAIENTSQSEE